MTRRTHGLAPATSLLACGTLFPLLTGLINVPRLRAQSQFEVASIKRNTACGAQRGGGSTLGPGRLHLECTTLLGAMYTAYGVYGKGATINPRMPEITGGPGWTMSDTYDFVAKAEGDAPFSIMAGPMLQALLKERFKLKVHRETKEVPVYFLTVAKNGPKLELTKEGACVPIDPDHPPSPVSTAGELRPTYCGAGNVQNKGSLLTMTSHGTTMEPFTAVFLSQMVGSPVIDKTGLTGRYEIQMEFAREGMADGPSIFEVLQQKFGLKLEPGKGPIEILVIDHVERPTEN